ncbi:S-methyl-5-thioadenosine phosphorylase [Entomophthora muscae]|uniref:S-methyl-5-thioadenosine phosphorylase n=1 Tax=Entomophthora muscae TaxID=34485 RepID=A0ACC2SLR4_9FUNG|nr:S-methyl-5-thioadenosine phosphorylase [Entomophthora muscae]
MASTTHTVKIAIIGGSGLYSLDGFQQLDTIRPQTPWGLPSDNIIVSLSPEGHKIAFLARHGSGHQFNPSEIPVRANIAALKSLGVEVILAFSAVGSLREEIRPADFVLPSQIIDRTKGFRENTFFEKGVTAHAGFADPFHSKLADLIYAHTKDALTLGSSWHKDKTLVCMEGPAFSTRAESHLYRSWNCDIINMSVIPEAKLAREAEIAYQMICMSTDYDCWRESEEPVSVQAVMATMAQNSSNAKKALSFILPAIEEALKEASFLEDIKGSMKFSIMSRPTEQNAAARDNLAFLFPEYFKE